MQKIIVVGAGAHSKVVLDVLQETQVYEIVGLVDDCACKSVFGIPVIGTDEDLQDLYDQGIRNAFVAIGSNQIREKVTKDVKEIGFNLVTIVSRNSIVSRYAKIGEGTIIMPGAVINADANIGEGCIINTNASVDHDCKIGAFTHIAPGCAISGSTTIGRSSFLGTGCRVIDKLTLGSNLIVGAGATVVYDMPGDCTIVGTPARIIKNGKNI